MCLANSQKFNELLDPENDASKLEAKQTESVLIFYKFLIIQQERATLALECTIKTQRKMNLDNGKKGGWIVRYMAQYKDINPIQTCG